MTGALFVSQIVNVSVTQSKHLSHM